MHKHATEAQKSTEGMVDYDRNSSAQQSIIAGQEAEIRRLVERLGPIEPELRIVDYGCGPGTSAITAVQPAIAAYRAKVPSGPMVVCHADQPGNDWNALFKLIWGPTGYQVGVEGIRTEAAVGSFYDRLLTPNSVDLGTCFAASHWLSHAIRVYSPGALWFADLEGDARRRLAELARNDWTRFLSLRANELRHPVRFGLVRDRAQGRDQQEAARAFVFSLWFLTADEARQPLQDDELLSRAFEIETITVTLAPHNSSDSFADLIADPVAYGDAYTGYTRAFADSTLRDQLFRPSSRDLAHENEIAQEFYDRFNDLYRTRLSKFAFELWHLKVVLRKR